MSSIEGGLRSPAYVAAFLIIGSLIFVAAERIKSGSRPATARRSPISTLPAATPMSVAVTVSPPNTNGAEQDDAQPETGPDVRALVQALHSRMADMGERVMKFGMTVTKKATSTQVTRAGVMRFVATTIK